MSEIIHSISWYLSLSILGLSVLPVAYRLFPALPSRGFAILRPLGLLIWGFVFWLFTSLGVLQNDLGGQILAYVALLACSILLMRGGHLRDLWAWLRERKKDLLIIEGFLLLIFILWVLVRGMNPEVAYTEKPMELAFINSILRSPTFPPQDPWLSGYAISYYYFGYVMVAMLARAAAVPAATAFNLASATWLAMTAAALYGIASDLTAIWLKQTYNYAPERIAKTSRRAGFLAPLFVLIISTIEGVLEFLHSAGVFWARNADGVLTSKFWSWLSILDLNQAPQEPFKWLPNRTSGWLWWRGSRVLQDLNLGNQHVEVIDEFPFFSFLLSDLHPHVLALPFTALAIVLALNLFVGGRSFLNRPNVLLDWLKDWTFWITAIILGSLAFINTWDFPIYVALFCLVWAFRHYQETGWHTGILWEFVRNGLVLGIAGIVLYLPFYLGFDSQAGGILPSLEYMTRGVHFWVHFGAILTPVVVLCIYIAIKRLDGKSLRNGAQVTAILFAGLFLLMMVYGALLLSFQTWGSQLVGSSNAFLAALGEKMILGGNAFAGVHGNYPIAEILSQAFHRRINAPGTWLTLVFLFVIVLGALLQRRDSTQHEAGERDNEASDKTVNVKYFVLILILFGALLTTFPEFFYLRDQFGTRMNTIFKFYFQAWTFWGIAAAVGSVFLFTRLKGWKSAAFQVLWILTVTAGLAYPLLMLWNKTDGFNMQDWTLDGNTYIQRYNPDEHEAITWLQEVPMGVVVEAVGGSYTDFARVSTRTGLPAVLGWPGHESQWRGGGEEMGTRLTDIQLLYETNQWNEAAEILQRYNVRYIFIGSLEHSAYNVELNKFEENLPSIFSNSGVTIYENAGQSGVSLP